MEEDHKYIESLFEKYCPSQTKEIVNKEALFKHLTKKLNDINVLADKYDYFFLDEFDDEDHIREVAYHLEDFLRMFYLYDFIDSVYMYDKSSCTDDFENKLVNFITSYKVYYRSRILRLDPLKGPHIERHEYQKERKEQWNKNSWKLDQFTSKYSRVITASPNNNEVVSNTLRSESH